MTLETGKPIAKIFSLQLYFSKRSFTSLLSWAYSNIPFSETIPLSLLTTRRFDWWDHSKKDKNSDNYDHSAIKRIFVVHWNKLKLQRLKTPKTRRIWRFWRISSRLVWPRKATLMEFVGLLNLSKPDIKVRRRNTGTWSFETQSFSQETPNAWDIQLWNDSSWQWQGQKHGYPRCYRPLVLSSPCWVKNTFLQKDLMVEG